MSEFNPLDWYWVVNGATEEVYASKSGGFVSVNNPAYVAWLAAGDRPTRIASEAELGEVLAAYSVRPVAASVLDGYQDTQSRQLTLQVVAKVLLWCVNEIRTLKGQQTITGAQFRNFIKGLM